MDDSRTWQRSTYCTSGTCVEMAYTRSSFCGSSACVEVGAAGDTVYVRDSKDPDGPALAFTRDEWTAFVTGVRGGEFDYTAATG